MRANEDVTEATTNRDYLQFAKEIVGDGLAYALFFTVAESETGLAFDVMDSKDFKEHESEFDAFEKGKANSRAWFLSTLVVLKAVDKRNSKATRMTDIR